MRVAILALFFVLSAQAEVILIRAGRLLDPATGSVSAEQKILVDGKAIKAVGADVTAPSGSRVIDLSKSVVLPGLMDCHTHLCYPPVRILKTDVRQIIPMRWETQAWPAFYLAVIMNPTGYRAIQGVANAKTVLESGFTTVRDLGHGGNYADTDLRRAIEEGLVPGPTILNSGRKICAYGGQVQFQPDTRDAGNIDYITADTRDEMKKAVRENIHYGARVIKIVAAGQKYIYSADDIRFIVEEAGRAGLRVASDCATAEGSRNAALGGVASIEHGVGLTEDDLGIVKKNGVALILNVPPASLFRDAGAPDEIRNSMVDAIRRAYRSGATLAFGTDVVFSMPGQTHGTLALSFLDSYVDAGVPAADILRVITVNAAELLGVEKERGAVRPGQAADIIAVEDNPLQNIQTLKKVTFVMKEGRVVR